MTAKKDESGQPENWKFASVRVLVVDEGSLVCVMLLHSILTMLTKHARLRKFVLLGERKHQTPPLSQDQVYLHFPFIALSPSLFVGLTQVLHFHVLSFSLDPPPLAHPVLCGTSWCAGDVRQLPSIMPGNTLHDLFHSLTLAKYAIEMRTNHRAESELIVNNSGR